MPVLICVKTDEDTYVAHNDYVDIPDVTNTNTDEDTYVAHNDYMLHLYINRPTFRLIDRMPHTDASTDTTIYRPPDVCTQTSGLCGYGRVNLDTSIQYCCGVFYTVGFC